MTSMRRNDVASTSLRRHVPNRSFINQCQIITFHILKYDIIENSRIELRGIVLPVQVGGLFVGGGGQRICWPPSPNYWGGGGWPPLAPPLPTPMYSRERASVLVVGVDGGRLDIFLSSFISLLSPSLGDDPI